MLRFCEATSNSVISMLQYLQLLTEVNAFLGNFVRN